MSTPTVRGSDAVAPGPVDAVFTWVDGGDPAWRRRFEIWSERCAADVGLDGRDASRYRDSGELRYALRAVARYAPWLRHIHVVTAGQIPNWLRPHREVGIVDHAEMLDPDSIPTFNSHAIESRLHHIPGLAEHFIYFNDDVFLARPQRPGDYFATDGRPHVALAELSLPDEATSTGASVDLGALVALEVLRRSGVSELPRRRPCHGPFALRRADLLELERRFAPELTATAHNRFRSAGDLPLPTFLAPVHGLATGAAVPGTLRVGYAGIDDPRLADHLAQFDGENIDAFCLNDTERVLADGPEVRVALDFLAGRYPLAAPWELAPTAADDR